MIKVEKFAYGGTIAAIEEVTFKIEKGEMFDFSGLNAAGETRSARIVTGLLPASNGSARVANLNVFQPRLAANKRISSMPENSSWFAEMTFYSFLESIAEIKLILEQKNSIFQNSRLGEKKENQSNLKNKLNNEIYIVKTTATNDQLVKAEKFLNKDN